ncbi:helix-turn-helix domain-containing protein [Paenibacillus eucommiae]|uniref:AraC-like DNA-binding protein n=1 Tax=Paenibacillus eucommiae TaxID=1355755 RepID=A0ABS4IQS7_9BACL|nr:helix-turn-helix domain-containing protein [Paenibacillus eucommiae]MBP1989929.1 AraC-like DNA-binding protein [Paenibacillus eucommiae]
MKYRTKFKNNVLTLMIISYSIFAVIIVGVIGIFLFTRANDIMVREISAESKYRLEKMSDFTEQSLLNKYEETFLNKTLPSIEKPSEQELFYFLNNPIKDNQFRIVQLVQNLNNSIYTFTETDNITLFFKKDNFLVDHEYFYESPQSHFDTAFIDELPSIEPYHWFHRTSANGKDLLTYVYTLPYKATGERIQGYMYIDISLPKMTLLYQDMLQASKENIYIFDENHNLLLSALPQSEHDMQLIEKLKKDTKSDFLLDKGDGQENVVSYLPPAASKQGWSYVMIRPMNNFALLAKNFKAEILLICIIVLIFGLIFSYFLSRRFYMPLKKLLFNIRNLYDVPKPFQPNNEYKTLDNAILFLEKKITHLEDEVKTKQLIQILNGSISNLKGDLKIPLNCSYIVTMIKTASGAAEEIKAQFDRMCHSYHYESVVTRDDEIVVLFFEEIAMMESGGGGFMKWIEEDLKKFFAIMNQTGDSFKCAVGSAEFSLDRIHLSYRNANEVFQYFFLYPDRKMLSYLDISERQGLVGLFKYNLFENALKAGNREALDGFLSDFAQSLCSQAVTMEAVELSLNQLVNTLAQVMVEWNAVEKYISISDLFANYKKISLHETIQGIREICNELILQLEAHSINSHEEVILELKQYIDSHLDEDISLDLLSQKASLSPSYISTLFGTVMKVSFSEYMTKRRLHRAAELLRNERTAVKDIAAQVGYRNVQYFCTKFKEHYAVTPIQYRNSRKIVVDQDPAKAVPNGE